MKLILLAAGQGKRLRPLTLDKPKCMVAYQGKPLIDRALDLAGPLVDKIAVVGGYKFDVLRAHLQGRNRVEFFENKAFASSNMVATLFCAREFFDTDDLIISYTDIAYRLGVLQALIAAPHDVSVVVDRSWLALWRARMQDPLSDAETMKISGGKITELGKKPASLDEVQGQYIGLIKIRRAALARVVEFYDGLDRRASFDGQSFENMYMTSFLQLLINRFGDVYPVFIDGGWVEIDSPSDLNVHMI